MMWAMTENTMQSDPLKECQDLLHSSSANSSSETYISCQDFVFKGTYKITVDDWKTHEEKSYVFSSWKLAAMVFDYPLEDQAAVSAKLTRTFGPTISENEWSGPDRASIHLYQPADKKKARLVVMFRRVEK